ncbi:MAG: response regulator [Candidatus Dactylopiibacterium sp.]|nr:response regulator [Candidatus Dactylopiibacterium sp.]
MSASQSPESRPDAPLKCFLVEDSPMIRENLIATLQEMLEIEVQGFAAEEATAIRWLAASDNQCDVVIIDIFLRSGSGLEVLRHARHLLPEAHLVVLTNFATQDMRRRCRELGADAVFDKSAELEELLVYCGNLRRERTDGGGHA